MEFLKNHLLDIPQHLSNSDWNSKIAYLLNHQLEKWPLAKTNYLQFQDVKYTTQNFDFFRIVVQYNPSREISTFANVSKTEIENRLCFLCLSNLPKEQMGFTILDKYILLINPYPIFSKHLTISSFRHTPQNFSVRLSDMLSISKKLQDFTIFYNGFKCGASAPDHFHFQAVEKNVMPIDFEYSYNKEFKSKQLVNEEDIQIFQVNDYLRSVLIFEAEYIEPIDYFFTKFLEQLPFHEESNEPMMNILANYENGKYRLTLFPRKQLRPSCYFKDGKDKIMVSPASVEMGGVIVTPREEDFLKIRKQDVETIYNETSLHMNITDILNI